MNDPVIMLRMRYEAMIASMRSLIDAMRSAEEPRSAIIMAEYRLEIAEREFRARFANSEGSSAS